MEKLAGKKVTFDVKINEIREPVPVKYDENFAKNLGMPSMKDLKKALEEGKRIIITTIQKFGLINDDSIWRSEIKLEDGRDSAIGIDSGIKLHNDQNPRITAVELNSGKIISQRKVEIND